MNWHQPTKQEIDGEGNYEFIVDVMPGEIPHMAAQDGNALLRVGRPGWTWEIKQLIREGKKTKTEFHWGEAETKEAAIGDALAKLGELRNGAT